LEDLHEIVRELIEVDFNVDKSQVDLVDHPAQVIRESVHLSVGVWSDWQEGWSEASFNEVVFVDEGQV